MKDNKESVQIAYLCYYPNHYEVFRGINAHLTDMNIDIVVRKTGIVNDY